MDGAAMGSPLSPVIANLYLESLEETAIQSAPSKTKLWARYICASSSQLRRRKMISFPSSTFSSPRKRKTTDSGYRIPPTRKATSLITHITTQGPQRKSWDEWGTEHATFATHKDATGNAPPKSGISGEWVPRVLGEEDPYNPPIVPPWNLRTTTTTGWCTQDIVHRLCTLEGSARRLKRSVPLCIQYWSQF